VEVEIELEAPVGVEHTQEAKEHPRLGKKYKQRQRGS
jgi:hypothetical protein